MPINNIQYHAKKLLSPEKFPHLWKQYQKFPKRFWKTREEKLNTISNVDDLIKDAEKMKKRYKLDNNYYFNPFKYGLL